jgi:CHAD domain-containing protein
VPPLGATLVAVGVGVALALAKAQLQRRSTPAGRGQNKRRRPALVRGEPVAEGLRRVMLGQLDLAIELLEEYPAERVAQAAAGRQAGPLVSSQKVAQAAAGRRAGPLVVSNQTGEDTVHELRKAFKRLRALLRLLRGELGAKRYARENAALRDCGRRLAGARDAEVMLGTLDSLVSGDPSHLAHSAAVNTLRAQLFAERDAATTRAINDARVRSEVLGELRAVRARAQRWELRDRGFKLIEPGLEGIYRRGRIRMRTARRRHSVEALHVWRKRVKELRYATETLDPGGKRYKPVRRVARRADRLGEMLGEEHDLALLEARVRERSRAFAGERKARKRLLKLIARRRARLRKRALREGEHLYRRPPRRFVRRLRRAHA